MSVEETTDEVHDEPTAVAANASDAGSGEEERLEIEHAPPRLSQGIAGGAALIGALLAASFATLAIPFGLAGLAITAASILVVHSVGWLSLGTALILVASLISGAYGVLGPELMLIAVGATLLAWDAGQHGIVIGKQLGRQTRSRRPQIVHVAASAFVIGLLSSLAYLIYLFAGSGHPAPAVSIIVVGVLILAWGLRS
jgi:hypothetical protein